MVRPQTEAIAIDKRDVMLQRKHTGTFGEPNRIRDRDELRMAELITVSGTQQVADCGFPGEAITLGRVLRLNHSHGGVSATVA